MEKEKFEDLSKLSEDYSRIPEELYEKYNVKRGLRNKDFTGVLVGLTHIGDVIGYDKSSDNVVPIDGKLFYRNFEVTDLVNGFQEDKRCGFDETVFLLLFGNLPNKKELDDFSDYLASSRDLSEEFINGMILTLKGKDVMNILSRCVLALYTLDENPDDTSVKNILSQCMNMIAKFPTIVAYSYHAMRHHYLRKHLVIRHPKAKFSTAENFLYMLKGNKRYTPLDVKLLDLALVLHAEHGGGNNSSFTTRVVSSSGTDTYSAIAAAIGSLKGPLHGGANHRVMGMMDELKKKVKDWKDEKAISDYLLKVLNKEAFDRSGKIYGFGHAVYTLSDPRAVLFEKEAEKLAKEKSREDEFELYKLLKKLVPKVFGEFKGKKKILSPNVDYYTGFVYDCMGIPKEVYTPLFAMARVAGWSAHRIEELVSSKRIIRPAYKNISEKSKYMGLENR